MTRTSGRLLLWAARLLGTVFIICGVAYIGLANTCLLDRVRLVSGCRVGGLNSLPYWSWLFYEQLHTFEPAFISDVECRTPNC